MSKMVGMSYLLSTAGILRSFTALRPGKEPLALCCMRLRKKDLGLGDTAKVSGRKLDVLVESKIHAGTFAHPGSWESSWGGTILSRIARLERLNWRPVHQTRLGELEEGVSSRQGRDESMRG